MTDQSEVLAVFFCRVREETIAGKIGPPESDKGGRRHYGNVSFRFRDVKIGGRTIGKRNNEKLKNRGQNPKRHRTCPARVESILYNYKKLKDYLCKGGGVFCSGCRAEDGERKKAASGF